jgi:predicted transcriptional regulator YheO
MLALRRKYWNTIKGSEERKISVHLKSLRQKYSGMLLCIGTVNTTQLSSVQGSVDKLIDMNTGYGQTCLSETVERDVSSPESLRRPG